MQHLTAARGPVIQSADEWHLYEPTINQLIREAYSSTPTSEDAITSTIMVNTMGMSARVKEIIKLLDIKSEDIIGDFGCGYGFMPFLMYAATGARVEAFDRSESFLDVGRSFGAAHPELADGVNFTCLDYVTESLPESVGPFDAIIMNNTLHYVVGSQNKLNVIRRLASLLKPGGALTVYLPNPWFPREPFTRLPMVHWLPRRLGSALSQRMGRRILSDIHYISPLGLLRLARRAGLENVSYHPNGQRRTSTADGFLRAFLAPALCRSFAIVGRAPLRNTASMGDS